MSAYHRYIAIVDDPTQNLIDHQYDTEGRDTEDARWSAQTAFPYGMIRHVCLADYSAAGDAYRARAVRRRKWTQARDRAVLRKNLPAGVLEPLLQAKSLE